MSLGYKINGTQIENTYQSYQDVGLVGTGQLWVWGYNGQGQLGLGDITDRPYPVQVGSLTNWNKIAVTGYHAVATRLDGTLWAWGKNNYGQLGLNDVVHRSIPVQVGSLTDWSLVSCGRYHTVAIKTDGTMWAWGLGGQGQLGVSGISNRSSPTQLGGSNWKDVACGINHTVAIKTDGTLWAWGYNAYGQLGLNNTDNKDTPNQVGTLTNWSKVGNSGAWATMAIKTDGTLWTWGRGYSGLLGHGRTTSYSSPVQVGALTNWSYVDNSGMHAAAIKTNGTLWMWGNFVSTSSPVQVGTLTNWNKIVCGGMNTNFYNVATKTDGTLWSWGSNNNGQLGFGDLSTAATPTAVGALTSWNLIACGKYDNGFIIATQSLPYKAIP